MEEIDERTQEQIRNIRSQEELVFCAASAGATSADGSEPGAEQHHANQVNDVPWKHAYGVGLVTTGFPFGFDNFHGFNRFNRFGFNNFNSRFGFGRGHFRGRLLFSIRDLAEAVADTDADRS